MTPQEALQDITESGIQLGAGDFVDLESLKVAAEALRKQIPQKPIGTYTDYKCPVCNRRIRSGKGSSSKGQRDNFCQRCGQKMDWED